LIETKAVILIRLFLGILPIRRHEGVLFDR
jgi:hypothetical protein